MADRKKMVRFNGYLDIVLLRETAAINPFCVTRNEATLYWALVASGFNSVHKENTIDGRRARERVTHLLDLWYAKDLESLKKSCTQEQYKEKEQLLDDLLELEHERPTKRKSIVEIVEREAQENILRRQAMEGQRAEVENDREAKKRQSSNTDILAALEEKKTTELELRREEITLQERRLRMEEERFSLDAEERRGMITLLQTLSKQNISNNNMIM